MASLTYVVQHELRFQTYQGSSINWEIDILRGYEGTTAPSWASTPPESLIGTANPVQIDWGRDDDPYIPIKGSTATLNLIQQTEGQYPDFSNGSEFEYQLRIRRRDSSNVLQDYWCGFFSQVNSSESITTFPNELNFTAIDRLSALADTTVSPPDSTDDITIFTEVLKAIYETGLDLPVYVDSGINQASSEALTKVTAKYEALYTNTEKTSLLTRKQLIEGFLSAFNCVIRQSDGKWYIYNASSHGGSSTTESNTWTVYEVATGATEYSAGSNVTEDLRFNLNSSSSTNLSVIDQDLVLNKRRPYGSVECRPTGLVARNLAENGDLAQGTATTAPGFAVGASSVDRTLSRVKTGYTDDAPSNEWVLSTNRSRFDLGEADDIWFETPFVDVDVFAPTEISFGWQADRRSNQVDNVRFNYQIEMRVSVDLTISDQQTYTNQYNSASPNNGLYSTTTTREWFWNFDKQQWQTSGRYDDSNKIASGTIRAIETTDYDQWHTETVIVNPAAIYDPATATTLDANEAEIRFRAFYGTGKRDSGKRNRGDGTNYMTLYFDNLSIQGMFDNDITRPVYERVQDNYTTTLTYTPRFVDQNSESISQTLNENDYSRVGRTETLTLERIVTQQKMNDFRAQFNQYEGTLINRGSIPLSFKNKILVDYNTYSETRSGIISGMTFDLKANAYDITFYVPNQSTDFASGDGTISDDGVPGVGFHPFDVNLIPMPFPGRSGRITYWLAFVVDGLDDTGNRLNTAESGTATYNSLEPDGLTNGVLFAAGAPGDEIPFSVTLKALNNYNAAASNMRWHGDGGTALSFFNSLDDDDTPTSVSNIEFIDSSEDVIVSGTITLPQQSEFEQIHIAGEVDQMSDDDNRVDVSFATTGITGTTITAATRPFVRRPNSIGPGRVIIGPPSGRRINASSLSSSNVTLSVTSPTTDPPTASDVINGIGFVQIGDSVECEFNVTIPSNIDDTDITMTINVPESATSTVSTTGTTRSTVTLTITDSVTNASIGRSGTITLTGAQNDTYELDIVTSADSGRHFANASNVSVSESPANTNVEALADYLAGRHTIITPIRGTFAATDYSATFTFSGNSISGAGDNTTYTINWTNEIEDADGNSVAILPGQSAGDNLTETVIGPAGSSQKHTTMIRVASGQNLEASSLTALTGWSFQDVGNDQVEASRIITFPNTGTTVENLTLSATSTPEPYTLQVNLQNNVSNTMLSTGFITIGYDDDDIGDAVDSGHTFTIQSNADSMAFTNANQVSTTTTDGVSVTYTISSGVITGTIGGSFPSPDSAGLAIVDLEIDAANDSSDTGSPPTSPATMGEFNIERTDVPRGGGLPSNGFNANGTVAFHISASATSVTGSVSWLANFIASYSSVEQTTGRVSHSGAVLGNSTGSDRTGWVIMTPSDDNTTVLDAWRITQTGNYNLMSSNITQINTSTSAPATGTASSVLTIRTS